MSTNLECEFCKKHFSVKNSLNIHKKTAKYCLVLQGKNANKEFDCEFCNKSFTLKQTHQEHLLICKTKNTIELKKKYQDYESYIEKIETNLKTKEDELKEKDNLITQLQEQIKQKEYNHDFNNTLQLKEQETTLKEREKYIKELKEALDKANETIADIAKMPKTTNKIDNRVNNNTVQIFDINDISKMTSMLENHLTPDVMRRGQEGVADMLKTHLLQTSTGNPTYECTDVARQKFEFRNADGNMETDPKATKLIRNLGRSGMWAKAHSSGKKLWEKADGSVNTDAMGVFMPNVNEVLEIDKDSSKLRRRLASITARQRAPVVSASSAK